MKKKVLFFAFFIGIALMARPTFAQNMETIFAEIEYMKVMPNMEGDYLKTEAVWKKVHQSRKAANQILAWELYRRLYPSGDNADFDYITVTVYKSGAEIEARNNSMNWDSITKGMNTQEIAIAVNTEKTRKLVRRELYNLKIGTEINKAGKYLMLMGVNTPPANRDEYEKMLGIAKPVVIEGMKAGKLVNWSVWQRTIASQSNQGDYTALFEYNTLNDALKNSSGAPDFSDEFKKIYPTKNFTTFYTRLGELRQVIGQELWERVDDTQ